MRSAIIAIAAIVVGLGVPAAASAAEASRHAAMVVDANTGKVLHDVNGNEPRHPASLTKIMTIYLALEAIESGRLSYASRLPISEFAASQAPSKTNLKAGDTIALIDAIRILIVKSANDLAVAVAEQVGGSVPDFVRLMNERAGQLGMTATRFTNPSGLPDPAQISTARDMLTLALRLQDTFPRHYKLFALTSFAFNGKVYRTHNALLRGFPGMDGIKTGYTRASGFNLVSSVRSRGKHIVAAVFGGATASARNAHMRSILNKALASASTERTRQPLVVAIAREAPRPAPRPQRAVAPVVRQPAPPQPPVVVARKPEPAPPKAPAAAETRRRPPVVASTSPGIAVAKVRALAFADTKPQPAPAAAPTVAAAPVPPPTAEPMPATVPRLDLMAFRRAAEEGAPAPRPPATIDDIITSATNPTGEAGTASDATPPAPPLSASPPPAEQQGHARSARAPSTLGAQAVALASPPPATRTPVAPAPAPAAAGAFEIQVGAFATEAEAEARLATARGRTQALLVAHSGVAVAVRKGERQVYRARFTRFSQDKANRACGELRRQSIDCFVMRAE